ncbi:MAG: 4-hydroxy-tetrahydrodipicolinate synthase [Actinomycetota bacterium]
MPVTSPVDPAVPFGRMLTAMVTPMRADGSVDLDATQALADHLIRHGHDGLVVSGTTGEAPTTTDDEKMALIRAVCGVAAGRAAVIAGVGTNHTAHSIELAGQAAAAGADGLLLVTPYYSKPPQAGVLAHFHAVADATGLPVMLYDIPGRTALGLTPETLVRAAAHPQIVAVKDAAGDLHAGSWVMARTDLAYYSGDDAANLAWLAHGAVGVVSVVGHVAGPQYRAMIDAVLASDLAAAQRLYLEVLPAVRGIMTRTQGVIMAKAALQLQGVLTSRAVRLPLVEATSEEIALLKSDLSEAALVEASQ